MNEPLVTIVVASFNGERFLGETLDSAFAQDYPRVEVVFVDDGSEDRTGEIARAYPVRYIRQENLGLPAARNAALTIANGELIAFLDDDDLLPPNKVSLQARYLIEHPTTGCVLGRQEWMFEEGVALPNMRRDPVFGDLGGVPMGTVMIRRHVLEDVGGFDPTYRYAEDRDLFVRLRERGVEIAVLPEVVLHRRLHGTNMTLNQPNSHPLLRSLRAKLERERTTSERD